MTTSQRAESERIVTLISGLLKNIALYPEGHPVLAAPLDELRLLLSKGTPETVIGIIDGVFYAGEDLFPSPRPAMKELQQILESRGIPAVVFHPAATVHELKLFAALLTHHGLSASALAAELAKAGVTGIRISGIADETDPDDEEVPLSTRARTYREAISAVQTVWKDVESGRIPASAGILSAVDSMARTTMQSPATLLGLAMIKNYDNYTFHHSVNVGILAMSLAAADGKTADEIRNAGVAGFLHDIGKTGIDKKITNKPGTLAPAEFEEMKKHAEIGARIIGNMEGIEKTVAEAVLGHHIYFNRKGYPDWARNLPFGELCEIVAIADMYDATTTLRVYQKPLTPKDAVDNLRLNGGRKLNPRLVEVFTELMGEYPVGTVVRLDTNELAVVSRPNPGDSRHPTVRVVSAPDGTPLPQSRKVSLIQPGGERYAAIVSVVNPALKRIDVAKILLEG